MNCSNQNAWEISVVNKNGWLKVDGVSLVNESNEPTRLFGVSSHGLQWYPEYANLDCIDWLVKDWGISIFRAAMYTAEGGYITNPSLKEVVKRAVDAAIKLGIYVIIDWHILLDNDPMMYVDEADAFFNEMSSLYGKYPNVLYEICNEPNGDDVIWKDLIKPYAQRIVTTIRRNAPKSIVIVGSGTYSQDFNEVAEDPLAFDNIMYAAHFYTGTHGKKLRAKIEYALSNGLAVMVTEWAATEASGKGGLHLKRAEDFLSLMDKYNISWLMWALGPRDETCAMLKEGARTKGVWPQNELRDSGICARALIRRMVFAEEECYQEVIAKYDVHNTDANVLITV